MNQDITKAYAERREVEDREKQEQIDQMWLDYEGTEPPFHGWALLRLIRQTARTSAFS